MEKLIDHIFSQPNLSKKISKKSQRKNTKYMKIDNEQRKFFIDTYFKNKMTIK